METKVCVRCGTVYPRIPGKSIAWWRHRSYCTLGCYRDREPAPITERFWQHVQKSDGCWEWTAARQASGYGAFGLNREDMMAAHRFSWELHFGPIPEGLLVCHHCDNPPCVRPDHLFLGTALANNRDMRRKGRNVLAPCKGEDNGNAKLTEDQVREIRVRRAAGERCVGLAAEFGVSPTLISYIVLRRSWRHVA